MEESKTHSESMHRQSNVCGKCVELNKEVTGLKEKLNDYSEIEENNDILRKMYIEKEKEIEKIKETNKNEVDKLNLDKIDHFKMINWSQNDWHRS